MTNEFKKAKLVGHAVYRTAYGTKAARDFEEVLKMEE